MREVIKQNYRFDEFTLDLVRGCLLGGNHQEIKLRPKSFATLKYLVENNGRLITKDELVEAVWSGIAVTDNSVVQCLKEVREALGDKSQHYIKTVTRRGYIFTELNGTPKPALADHVETVEKQKIAVLPFKSLSGGENEKYLGLGIADTLITRLGSTKEIIVRPTSSIQKYDSIDQDSIAAGREQQVDAVLEGSIQKSGDKMRVTVRLLRVMDGSTLWTYKSDEDFVDVFALEDSVSEKLVNALALNLTSQERQRLAKHYTANTEAHQLYAKGVFLRNQMSEEGLLKSIDCFRRAIELDPQYALAYAGQASSISPLAFLGFITVREAESRNRTLITKALGHDSELAEAHAAQGEFKLFIEWDWAGAERAFKRALELNPNEPLSQLLYPDLLMLKGQTDEALAMEKKAFELDPLSARTGKALAHFYYYAEKYDQALEQSKATLDLHPNYRMIFLGPIYEQKGMYDEAIKEYLKTEERWGLSQINLVALREAYAANGWRGYWQKRLELLKSEAEQKPVSGLRFAEVFARLGDKDRAFEWLEKAYDNHEMGLVFLKLDPMWESFHSDPRFGSLLQRMSLS